MLFEFWVVASYPICYMIRKYEKTLQAGIVKLLNSVVAVMLLGGLQDCPKNSERSLFFLHAYADQD